DSQFFLSHVFHWRDLFSSGRSLRLRLLLSSFLFSGHRRSLPPSHVHHESGLHTTSRCIDSNDRHAAAKAFPSKQEPYCFGGRSHEVRTVGAPRTRLPSTCRSACVDRSCCRMCSAKEPTEQFTVISAGIAGEL